MGTQKESAGQKQLDDQQSQLLKEQQDEYDKQKKELKQRQLDFIGRLQGQASTPAGASTGGNVPNVSCGAAPNSNLGNMAPFGISGLFTGSNTIG